MTTSTPKSLNQLLAFLDLYQHEKITLFHLFIFEIQSILESRDQTAAPIFDLAPPSPPQKNNQLLIFDIMYQHVKNQFIPSVHSSVTVNFRIPSPGWAHPFLTMLTPKIFNHLLIWVKLYQHAKNQFIPTTSFLR